MYPPISDLNLTFFWLIHRIGSTYRASHLPWWGQKGRVRSRWPLFFSPSRFYWPFVPHVLHSAVPRFCLFCLSHRSALSSTSSLPHCTTAFCVIVVPLPYCNVAPLRPLADAGLLQSYVAATAPVCLGVEFCHLTRVFPHRLESTHTCIIHVYRSVSPAFPSLNDFLPSASPPHPSFDRSWTWGTLSKRGSVSASKAKVALESEVPTMDLRAKLWEEQHYRKIVNLQWSKLL
jgi:hypothetical protein